MENKENCLCNVKNPIMDNLELYLCDREDPRCSVNCSRYCFLTTKSNNSLLGKNMPVTKLVKTRRGYEFAKIISKVLINLKTFFN